MSKKKSYIFTNKDHPQKGIMSAILGTISIITLIVITYFAFTGMGDSGRQGATALLVVIFSFIGGVLGILGLSEQDTYKVFPVIGILLNVISLGAISLILYAGAYGI